MKIGYYRTDEFLNNYVVPEDLIEEFDEHIKKIEEYSSWNSSEIEKIYWDRWLEFKNLFSKYKVGNDFYKMKIIMK